MPWNYQKLSKNTIIFLKKANIFSKSFILEGRWRHSAKCCVTASYIQYGFNLEQDYSVEILTWSFNGHQCFFLNITSKFSVQSILFIIIIDNKQLYAASWRGKTCHVSERCCWNESLKENHQLFWENKSVSTLYRRAYSMRAFCNIPAAYDG